MAKGTSVAVNETKSTAVAMPSAFAEFSGAGFEQVTKNDVVIPFFRIVHGLSPQMKPGSAKYNEKAKIGNFVDTALNQVFDSTAGIDFVPVAMVKTFVVWPYPRTDGSFPISQHTESDPIVQNWPRDGLKFVEKDGQTIVQTYMFYGMLLDGEDTRQVVITMTGSSIKVAKSFLTLAGSKKMGGQQLPFFSQVYKLTTFTDKNQKGQDFPNWKVEHVRQLNDKDPVEMAVFNAGKNFYKGIVSGTVKVDESQMGEEEGSLHGAGIDQAKAGEVI